MDIRQSENWGQYLSAIGWKVEKFGPNQQAFIRTIPLIRRSIIKIQHPDNPLSFAKIDQIANKYKALFVEIEPVTPGFKEQQFIENGYRKSSMSLTHTATITLNVQQSLENLWSSFSENARRNIKKSQSYNLKVEKIILKNEQNDLQFKKFYNLFVNLTKLKKFYIPGYQESYKRMLAFKNNSMIFFARKKEDNSTVAAVWMGVIDDTAIYMNTGITEEGYKLLANYLLVWEALKTAKKLKLKVFDFEGIYDPRFPQHRKSWQKFSEFKKRFHGQTVEYPAPWIKFYSLPFKIFFLCNTIFSK